MFRKLVLLTWLFTTFVGALAIPSAGAATDLEYDWSDVAIVSHEIDVDITDVELQ